MDGRLPGGGATTTSPQDEDDAVLKTTERPKVQKHPPTVRCVIAAALHAFVAGCIGTRKRAVLPKKGKNDKDEQEPG